MSFAAVDNNYLEFIEFCYRHWRMRRDNNLPSIRICALAKPAKQTPEAMRFKACFNLIHKKNGTSLRHAHANGRRDKLARACPLELNRRITVK